MNNSSSSLWLVILFTCSCIGVFISCKTTAEVEQRLLTVSEIGMIPSSFEQIEPSAKRAQNACNNQESYLTDTNLLAAHPVRYMRINMHWMNSADSSQNVPESEAKAYARDILHALNYALENNKPSWLPYGNDLPVHPINFRYELTGRPGDPDDDGIYYHYDDELYFYVHHRQKDANLYSRDVFDKYGIQLDTVLNIFLMPHHPDSVASKTYKASRVGVALRNATKVAATWREDWESDKKNFWRYRGYINHEVGHLLGLSHAWTGGDGCVDTPKHPNRCWSRDHGNGCDTLCSNNVMDYNSLQLAWTPHQIARVHKRFADPNSLQRKFLVPDWCTLQPDAQVTIRDSVVWEGMKDLNGNLIIAKGGHLTIRCRTSIPADGTITIKSGGTLVLDGGLLHQSCDQQWKGIIVETQNGQSGTFVLLNDGQIENWTPSD
jgi:hypothetical protein